MVVVAGPPATVPDVLAGLGTDALVTDVADIPRELRRQISLSNPLWGAPHVHAELLKR